MNAINMNAHHFAITVLYRPPMLMVGSPNSSVLGVLFVLLLLLAHNLSVSAYHRPYFSLLVAKSDLWSLLLSAFFSPLRFRARSLSMSLWLPRAISDGQSAIKLYIYHQTISTANA
jgi:hypothetical protein